MRKLYLFISVLFISMGCLSCSSDDNSTVDDTTKPIPPPVNPEPEKQIEVAKYYDEILGTWKWTKKQFLDKDQKLISEIDLRETQCGVEEWIFTKGERKEEDSLVMKHNYVDEENNCKIKQADTNFGINEKLLIFLYPSEDQFLPVMLDIIEFYKKSIILREKTIYDEDSASRFNYPENTVYVQFVLYK